MALLVPELVAGDAPAKRVWNFPLVRWTSQRRSHARLPSDPMVPISLVHAIASTSDPDCRRGLLPLCN